MDGAKYSPPWANTFIIGLAGGSGSGKTSLAKEIVSLLNLPWVVILSMDSFYKSLSAEESQAAFKNEYDFDAPEAIDFDILVEKVKDIKQGRKAEIPAYSFAKHQREEKTESIYSPHVLVLEGIFALYDSRILDLLDMKIFAEADADTCLARRITRDVESRGRDVEGCIKQWFAFVKPNFERYVEPQRKKADIIVPRGIENKVAIDMIVKHIQRVLQEKSEKHSHELQQLQNAALEEPLGDHVKLMTPSPQIVGMSTILRNPGTQNEDFIFYFDRLATLLVSQALEFLKYRENTVITPLSIPYKGVEVDGVVSAVVILRGGSALETGLKRVIPSCITGRLLIQSSPLTSEPELHYLKLPPRISTHTKVLLLDAQMSSGGAALMAVRVLIDYHVSEEDIVFVSYSAGKNGVKRLAKVYPKISIVLIELGEDLVERWVEKKYFGC
ncbi:MAG: Uridine-cytidine kinase-like 1 [Vezdaea aestivalis]|nr:MAG: Uridine-cytidine kinase-like 1 [Vezdaea aestivalis]